MPFKAALFDAYGTVLDVTSATRRLVNENRFPELADKADSLTSLWRSRQLHYSWLRSLMGRPASFWQLTEDGLDFALASVGLAGDDDLRDALLALYRDISAYDDAGHILPALKEVGLLCGILSNGNHKMLNDALGSAGLLPQFDKIISAEDCAIFKPAPQIYQMGCEAFGISADEVLFFSSNGWDIAGAGSFGYRTIWVNRTNEVIEELPAKPDHIVSDLTEGLALALHLHQSA